LAASLNLAGSVTFHGRYDHRVDLPDIIANNHLFTYTSNYEGGPCFTLLELLQAGRYVVASPVGGIPDIYEGYPEAGLLVEPGNPGAIADMLQIGIHRVASGTVDSATIRERYHRAFDMAAAHTTWRKVMRPYLLKNHTTMA
jgi:glycosyltransferase involved in cell wall biosynthesis